MAATSSTTSSPLLTKAADPVSHDFAFSLTRSLYDLLVEKGEPLPRAIAAAGRDHAGPDFRNAVDITRITGSSPTLDEWPLPGA